MRLRSIRFPVGIAVAAFACGLPPPALADSIPYAHDGNLPWAGGLAETAIEVFAGTVASEIAGRPVHARCEDPDAWTKLATERNLDPNWLWGYVRFGSDFTELAPIACWHLQQFALANPKPTKCAVKRTESRTVTRTERVRVRNRVKIRGRWVWRWVWETRTYQDTESVEVEEIVPCYANGRQAALQPSEYWRDYRLHAFALSVLAHEAFHLRGIRDEATTECYAMQWTPRVAERFGATPDDARALTLYLNDFVYPARQRSTPEYWSPECRSGGALDLSPGDGIWP